ncbi:MAG: chloride channel protein [Gaiellales bacterium]
MSEPAAPAATTDDEPAPKDLARILVVAVVVGVVGAIGASVFLEVVHELQHLAYASLPDALGIGDAPWWWTGILLVIGATIVLVAQRLPGHTGPGPLTGFHFGNPLGNVPGILLAAIGTLVFGVALGPEAPLIVLGAALGMVLLRRSGDPKALQAGGFLGGTAAIGAIFGNPFITAFMILEFAAFGVAPAVLILPVLVALGASYLVQVGIAGIPGVGIHPLSLENLPAYDHVQVLDLIVAAGVAIVAGLILVIAREAALRVERLATSRRALALYATAALTTLAVLIAVNGFGATNDEILFSGQTGMPQLIAETSLGLVVVILAVKLVAYTAALGSGFRGGPIFPATFIGVGVAVAGSLIVPDANVSALAATGIAAGTAAMIKLPATSALLGLLLISGAGAAIAPFAILGSVFGLILRLVVERRIDGTDTAPAAGAPGSSPPGH